MSGTFFLANEIRREKQEWGSQSWLSSPLVSHSRSLVVIDLQLDPGRRHNFHKHPVQEELIYVIEGEIEQWIDHDRRTLGPGDSAFIGSDVVHASFNRGRVNARLLAILSPSIGPSGYECVEVAHEEPWLSLR